MPRTQSACRGTRLSIGYEKDVTSDARNKHKKKKSTPIRDLRVEALDWLGRRDSNPRVTESKSVALPLGDGPKYLYRIKAAKGTL